MMVAHYKATWKPAREAIFDNSASAWSLSDTLFYNDLAVALS
jgi:hypothetical protein